jgi:opacity protein-like surface antigen
MRLNRAALVLSIIAGSALSAQSPMRFGIEGHFASPTGKAGDKDHLDGKAGYGLGLVFPVDNGNGSVFRSKVDFYTFSRTDYGITSKSDIIAVLADYNYYFQGKSNGGPYMIAGIGYNSTKREYSSRSVSIGATTSGFAYNFGLGLAVNPNFAFELKYMGADLQDLKLQGYLVDKSFTANATVLSLVVLF